MAGPGIDQVAVSPPLDLDEPFVAARCRHRALRQRRRGDGRIRVQWTHDPNLPGPTVRLSPPSGEERDWRDFYDWYDAVQYGAPTRFDDPGDAHEFRPSRIVSCYRKGDGYETEYDRAVGALRVLDSGPLITNNPTLRNPACTVCHRVLDPVAGAFQNYGDDGYYRDQ